MIEPSQAPESQRSEAQLPVDPLAETRMAPAEPIIPPLQSPADKQEAPAKKAPLPEDPLSETFAVPSHHATLQIESPEKDVKPPALPASTPPDPLGETRMAPPSRVQDASVDPFAPTRLARPSEPPKTHDPSGTIAHLSNQADTDDPAYKNTRVVAAPSATDKDSGFAATLVVDSTKQPPVLPGVHDTPLVATPGFSSVRTVAGVPQHVGDYEILGVLGRGGMGVVYKAKQKQLNRVVALKMVLGGLHASDDDLRRFRQEAEASARLQHPNIVQIHEVGEIDGKPYFSLEYVDGGSLAGKMASEPQAPFPAAQLIEILARAMHYAHQRGIVHRDLKPANILLASAPPDGSSTAPVTSFGIPKITDFGLAKRMDVDLGQTQTGAILGTPSYMAPEQAGGRIREIGPATDVYALGAILYDLLTGRPPFKSNTLADTLRQVQMSEPVSPGRLQPQVPRDLATICLKCLNKEPKKRYETSLALAEDLGRFLAGEPIRARPTSLVERTLKWARRRPAIAALIAVSVLSFVALGVGGWWSFASLYSSNQKTIKARDEAQSERVRAEDNLEQALAAIDGMLTQLSVNLDEVPLMEKPRAKILNNALALFNHLPRKDQNTSQAQYQSARARARLGEIEWLLDRLADAEKSFTEAGSRLRGLNDAAPNQPEYRTELARTYHDEGLLYRKKGLLKEAEQAFRGAMDQRAELAKEFPEDLTYLRDQSQSTYWLGTTFARMKDDPKDDQKGKGIEKKRDNKAKAEEMYKAAIAMQDKLLIDEKDLPDAGELRRDYQRDKARMLNNLGLLYGNMRRKQKAIETLKAAEAIQNALASKNRDIPTIRREQARTLNNLAIQQWDPNEAQEEIPEEKHEAANTSFERAIDLLEALLRDFPSVPGYRDELATVYRTKGVLFQQAKKEKEADEAFAKALAIHQSLVKDFPQIPDYQSRLADDYLAIAGNHLADHSSLTFEQMLGNAVELQKDLVKRFPNSWEYHKDLYNAWTKLGTRIDQRRSPDAADFFGIRGTATLLSVGSVATFLCREGCPPVAPELAVASTIFANSILSSEFVGKKSLLEVCEADRLAVQEIKAAYELEPRNKDYRDNLLKALFSLGNAELHRGSHADVAKVAKEYVALKPDEVAIRLQAAEFWVRAIALVRVDPLLDRASKVNLEEKYAAAAIENLREAGRISSEGGHELILEKELKFGLPYWQRVLERRDFKEVVKEVNERTKRIID